MGKINAKGRSKYARHVRLYHSMIATPAWQDLSGLAVKLLVLLASMDNGENNGALFLSVRDAAKALKVAPNTAHRAFEDLRSHGFIAAVDVGHFHVKVRVATTWRLTWAPWPGRGGPTNDFMRWPKAESRSQNLNGTVAKIETVRPKKPVTVAKIDTVDRANPQKCVIVSVSKIETQLVTREGDVSETVGNVIPIRQTSTGITSAHVMRGAA